MKTFKSIKITRNSFDKKVMDRLLLNNSKISSEDLTDNELYMIEYSIHKYARRSDRMSFLMPVSKRLVLDFISFDDWKEIYLINNSWTKPSWQL